jgi:hypothetical protein
VADSRALEISYPSSYTLQVDQYFVSLALYVATIAKTDSLEFWVLWKTSIPTTIVGSLQKGMSETAQGSPPIFAQI